MKQLLHNMLAHWVTLTIAATSGLANFFSWIFTLAPESQTAMLLPLVDILPIHYRPQAALALRGLGIVTGIVAAYRAARSGPKPTV